MSPSLMTRFLMTQEEYDRLNPPTLSVTYDDVKGKYFIEMLDHPGWIPVGYIPSPNTRMGWFFYHMVHGLAMRYPFHKVFYYSLTNTYRK